AKDIKGKSNVGTEVLVVHVVDTTNSLTNLNQSSSGDEISLFVLSITNRSVDLVSQTIIQSQTRLNLPVVLSVESDGVLVDVTVGVSEAAICQVRFAQQQLFYIALNGIIIHVAMIAVVGGRNVVPGISHRKASSTEVSQAIGICALKIAANLYRVV